MIGCFGLTEPHGGSDPANMKTHAKKDGADWVINGAKMWITNGNLAAHRGRRGRRPTTASRASSSRRARRASRAQEIHKKMSLRASVTVGAVFDNVRVPEANRLPNVKGLKGPLGCLTQARYGITWGADRRRAGLPERSARIHQDAHAVRPPAGREPGGAAEARRDGAPDHHSRSCSSLQLGRLKDTRRDAADPGVAREVEQRAAWRSTSRANARDILGGAGITTEHCPIRHALNLESVITYEGTETVHQLVVGRELTGINAF